jgi:two-component system, NarL family, sensor kinase
MASQKIIIILIVLTTFIFLILMSFIFSILILHRRKQRNYKNELALIKANYEKELLSTQLEIQEQTFNHIALELHDNVGHFISVAKLYLTTISSDAQSDFSDKLNHSISLLTSSLEEVRNISRRLNTENIKENGLIKTVHQLINQVEKTNEFKVEFRVSGKTCYLEDQKEIVLFRIVQEAFNNIIKHSHAKEISINLEYEEEHLVLTIRDDGIGFNLEETLNAESTQNSSGLKNITRRSKIMNATHFIKSKPGEGTSITVITPYKKPST